MTTSFTVCFIAALLSISTFSISALSDDSPIIWTDTNLSLLHGSGFKVTGDDATTLTLEHASGWSFGDLFMFVEYSEFHDNPVQKSSWYGEFSPRFSLSKMGLVTLKEGSFLKDISIATNYERGKGGVESLLIGAGTSLDIKGFNFVDLNLYARKDTGAGAGFEDAQLTLVWSKSLHVSEEVFVIDGFMDWVVGWGPQESSLHLVPQVKWDFGRRLGMKNGKLYLGSEIDFWSNKFGIGSSEAFRTNQIAINLLLKAHF